jgi:hypothetical protein
MLFLSSCAAFHSGYLANSAALSSGNFKYVIMDAQGTSKATYFLGIGGLARTALVSEAKENLLDKYPLNDNQVLVNVTVNWKHSYYPFLLLVTNKCTVTADIVEFK